MAASPVAAPGAVRTIDTEKLAALKTGTASAGPRTVDQVMERAALIMIPVGLGLILLGWRGTSQTPWLFEQIPYLISGAVLGAALLIGGGMAYLASWLSRSIAARRQDQLMVVESFAALQAEVTRLAELQEKQLDALHLLSISTPASGTRKPAVKRTNGSPAAKVSNANFLATPSGTMFHTPDCGIVSGRTDLRRVTGTESGMKPCGMCDPVLATS